MAFKHLFPVLWVSSDILFSYILRSYYKALFSARNCITGVGEWEKKGIKDLRGWIHRHFYIITQLPPTSNHPKPLFQTYTTAIPSTCGRSGSESNDTLRGDTHHSKGMSQSTSSMLVLQSLRSSYGLDDAKLEQAKQIIAGLLQLPLLMGGIHFWEKQGNKYSQTYLIMGPYLHETPCKTNIWSSHFRKNTLMYFYVNIFWSTDFSLVNWSSWGSTRDSHNCKVV